MRMHNITQIMDHRRDFINHRPFRGGNLLWERSIQNKTTYMVWDSLQEPPMHTRICTSSIGTHGTIDAVRWEAWGSTRVMKIPTFTTGLKIESYKGQDKTCNKVWDEGSSYLVSSTSNIDGHKED